MVTQRVQAAHDRDAILRALYGSGIIARRGAFSRGFVADLREDVDAAFAAAIERRGGAVSRGPARYYVEVHPQALRGFVELVTQPWFVDVCETVLGPDYEIVELGFEIPFPGAQDQPWHRDFPAPPETARERRLTSLAFDLTCIDTTPAMGAFEIAPGTHWETGADWPDGMFPPRTEWARYEALVAPKLPQAGDLAARSALAIHRGTANRSPCARPVFVIRVVAPGTRGTAPPALQVTRAYHAGLPAELRRHLVARVVDRLEPTVQKPQLVGLLTVA